MREHRPKYRDLPAEARKRADCRSHSFVLEKRGRIVRQPCNRCGGVSERHHPDYDDPWLVEWLCRRCHLKLHREARAAEAAEHDRKLAAIVDRFTSQPGR